MRFQHLNRDDIEVVYATAKNTSGAATAIGDWAVYDYTTEADGISTIVPVTAMLKAPAGCWTQVVADDGYGSIQIYGHSTAAAVEGGISAVAPGDPLILKTAVTHAVLGTYGTSTVPVVAVAGTTQAGTANSTVFIQVL